jgi:hypothetical protein
LELLGAGVKKAWAPDSYILLTGGRTMKKRYGIFRIAAWVLLLIVGTALMATGDVLAQEKVIYRLKWLINASTAGDVFALGQGFFSSQGLEVAVKAGGRSGMPSGSWNWGTPSSVLPLQTR